MSDENLSYDRMPFSCLKCNKKIIEGIELFNKTQDVSTISELDCECKINYQNMLEQEGTAVEQIKICAFKI